MNLANFAVKIQTYASDCVQKTQSHFVHEGDLIDVSAMASGYFKVPVKLSKTIWDFCYSEDSSQHYTRVLLVICQAHITLRHADPKASEVTFEIKAFPRDEQALFRKRLKVMANLQGDRNQPELILRPQDEEEGL